MLKQPQSLLLALLIAAFGCSPADKARLVVERDSSGIRIIESDRPAWEVGEEWRIGADPLVRIGSATGADGAVLFNVADIALLSDGRLVAANSGDHEVLVFATNGQLVRRIGREGNGPGELNSPKRVWVLAGDSVAVLSFTRFTVFDSSGVYARSTTLPGWSPHDLFGDGAWLWQVIPPGEDTFAPGPFQPRYAFVRTEGDGSGPDTIAYASGDQMHRLERNGGVSSWPAPFGAKRMAAAFQSSIYTGDGLHFEVQQIDLQGNVARIIRRRASILRLSRAATDSFEAEMLAGARTETARQTRVALFREWDYPTTRPLYDDLHVDKRGNVWARHAAIAPTSAEWTVFDSAGVWLGTVRLPAGVDVKEIGGSHVAGVMKDDLGVEYIVLYRLEKNSG